MKKEICFPQATVFLLLPVLLFFSSLAGATSSHPLTMKFDHAFNLGKQGMRSFVEDQDGFIWIGSLGGGLFRWNGYDLKNYKAAANQLSEGTIYRIVEDTVNPDILWLATNGGLNRFDKSTETFTYYQHDAALPESISDNGVKDIVQDTTQDHILWVGTRLGLNKFDKQTGQFTRYYHQPGNQQSLESNYIWQLEDDPVDPDILWVLPFQRGVDKFNKKTGVVTRYHYDPVNPGSPDSTKAASMALDKDDPSIIWIGTLGKGLDRFDTRNQTFTRFPVSENGSDGHPGGPIIDIFDDGDGRLWLCGLVANNGLTIFDKTKQSFTNYRHVHGKPYSLVEDTVASVNRDRMGRYWVTSYGGDVSKIDPYNQNFELFTKTPALAGGLSDNSINRIVEDHSGTVWVTTNAGGLNRFDDSTATFKHYRHNPQDKQTIDVDNVFDFFEDSQGRFWLSQFLGPLVEFDPTSGTVLKRYPTVAESFTIITEDPERPGYLWLGLRGLGLAGFDTVTETFQYYNHNPQNPEKGPGNEMVRVILHDRLDNTIWIGSNLGGGLSRFNKRTQLFTHYKFNPNDTNSLGSDAVNAIFQDREGSIWIATAGGGLNKFDRDTETFIRYGQRFKIPDNIMTILQDDQGKLWLSTDEGLLQFCLDTMQIKAHFSQADGLQGKAFNLDCGLKRKNGELWFGGTNGLNRFFPDKIVKNSTPPKILITALKQGGSPITLDKIPEKTQSITLYWPNNFFEFEFAALNYTQPEKNHYRYILEGLDNRWFESGTRRYGRYTNIPGGSYTLRVIGSNNDGVWNGAGVALEVIITPPFWKSSWFFLLTMCLTFLLIGVVILYFNKLKNEIVEREQAEKKREESESRYRSLLESQTELVSRYKPGGELTFVNQVFCEFFNRTYEELLGQKWQTVQLYDDFERIETKFKKLSPQQPTVMIENSVRSGSGEIRWMQFVQRGFFDENGKLSEIQSVGRDITERRKVEEALSESETFLKNLINSIPDLIWLKNEEGIYLLCNSKVERLFGTSEAEIVGKTDYDFVDSDLADLFREYDRVAIAEGISIMNEELVTYADDGHQETLETVKTPIYDNQGRLIGILGVARDITERKWAEQQREKLESQLRQSHKMEAIGTIAGGIAHDFNNILGIIVGNVELALDGVERWNPVRQNLDEIKAAGFRASEVVAQLLNFSRKIEQDKKQIDFGTIIRESIRLLRASFPSSIEIQMEVAQELHPIIADPTQLHQVLINLCTNAAHAMEEEGGVLRIQLTEIEYSEEVTTQFQTIQPGSYCQLLVSDTGCGINPEIVGKIFDPYFTTKEVGRGTGMGLAVVLGIVKNHNGVILVESTEGEGTSFTVLFPVSDEVITAEEPDLTSLPTGNESILIVDDEQALVTISSRILRNLGYTVEAKTDPQKALHLYCSYPSRFDLIITDMTMPHLTGDQLLREVLKNKPSMPVILTTGFHDKIDRDKAMSLGARGYIEKPFDTKELAHCVRNALDMK